MSVGGGSVVGMAGIPEALEQVRSALVTALGIEAPRGLGDDELLLALGALEGVGRLLDAHRAAFAGEVAERSRIELGGQRFVVGVQWHPEQDATDLRLVSGLLRAATEAGAAA